MLTLEGIGNMVFNRHLTMDRVVQLTATEQVGAFRELVDVLCRGHRDLDPERVLREIRNREALVSTRISDHIAIPHAQLPDFGEVSIAAGWSSDGVDYDLLSDEKVYVIIMIIGDGTKHLQVLSDVAGGLRTTGLEAKARGLSSSDELFRMNALKRKR